LKYFDVLEVNKTEITHQLELLFIKYKVQPVGDGYIDCIIIKNHLEKFIKDVSNLGILISDVSWWCYVAPNHNGFPHGMGGPKSMYYDGWFSELQNELYTLDKSILTEILVSYNKQLIYSINLKTLEGIKEMIEMPFQYAPNKYIEKNKCVQPALWLLVPDAWKRHY
jgi:hypothetical protein